MPGLRRAGRALGGLARVLLDLLRGGDPPQRPAAQRRLARLYRYRTLLGWLCATLVVFPLGIADLTGSGRGDVEWPIMGTVLAGISGWQHLLFAALFALQFGVAVGNALLAWRLVVLAGVLAPVAIPAVPVQDLPWTPVQILVAVVVLYLVAARHPRRLVVGVWLFTVATVTWGSLITPVVSPVSRDPVAQVWLAGVLVTAVMGYGHLNGTRRRMQGELAASEQRHKQEEARRALLEERARIARELHDVVAHHMSVIAVRSETAPFRIPDLSEAGKVDVTETSAIAREALIEMRRVLGVLRGADTEAEREPQPSLDRIDQLVDGVRRAGLTVDSRVVGVERSLPPGVRLSAYRIVQEALSNALRHAPGACADVEIAYEPDCLRLRVENGAPPSGSRAAQPSGPGHGILGIQERAGLVGGWVSTGPTATGGFLVEAVLPLGGQPSEPASHEQARDVQP